MEACRRSPRYCPVFLDIEGKRCVVVGGGRVALRKVRMLLDHDADVLVVSPRVGRELGELAGAGKIRVLRRGYQAKDLAGAGIAISATSDGRTNERVARDARLKKIMVNVVDRPALSDFIVPSSFRRGDLAVAVSTSGKSPALAKKVRADLEKAIGKEYSALTRLVEDVRRELRSGPIEPGSARWQQALDLPRLIRLLDQGKRREARALLMKALNPSDPGIG